MPEYFSRYYLGRFNSASGESVPKPKVFSGSTRRANPQTHIMLATNARTRSGMRNCVEKNYRRTYIVYFRLANFDPIGEGFCRPTYYILCTVVAGSGPVSPGQNQARNTLLE